MSTCKYCSRSGWLVTVDGLGLCDACHVAHYPTIIQKSALYDASIAIVVKSKNTSTTLTRLLVAAQCCRELEKYQSKGIPTIGMPISDALDLLATSFNEAVAEAVRVILESARQKAITAASDAGRLGAYATAADKLLKLAAEFPDVAAFSDRIHDVQVEQDALRFELLSNKSDVALAKGLPKKALAYAIDAFMALKHDGTADELQRELFSKATSRIEALGGSVAELKRV